MPPRLPPTAARVLGALPDLLTALACLVVWVAPLAFGPGAVKTVVLMMLMEFLLVNGAGFFTGIAFMDDVPRSRRVLFMLGLLGFYSLFIAAFALSFDAWWPVWVFAWLVVGKALWIFTAPRDREQEQDRQMQAWAFSVAAYLAAVFGGVLLPLPQLGITQAVVAQAGLPGGGEWVERPHIAVAGMAFYYLAQTVYKCARGGEGAPPHAAV